MQIVIEILMKINKIDKVTYDSSITCIRLEKKMVK